jgi:hemerythrin-like domain-containing protein
VDADVHPASSPFGDPACGQGRERETAVKLTDALLGEHGLSYVLFDQIEAVTTTAASVAQIQAATVVLSAVVLSHANLEEELLYPALEPHIGTTGPLAVMRAEHDEIKRALQQIEKAQGLDDGTDCVARALSLVREHFQKEEEVLFSVARQTLDDETQIRLGQAWAEARRVTIA